MEPAAGENFRYLVYKNNDFLNENDILNARLSKKIPPAASFVDAVLWISQRFFVSPGGSSFGQFAAGARRIKLSE